MDLFEILTSLVVAVSLLLGVSLAFMIDRSQLRQTRRELGHRIRSAFPFVGFLGMVLLFNAQFRTTVQDLSHIVGFRITHLIFRLEGDFILFVQSLFGQRFDLVFTVLYIYGYVFLLVFPIVAYFLLDRLDTFKSLTLAYAVNYGIGLICYLLFVAYGPRNMIVIEGVIQPLPPEFQLLTTEFNESTNVFPSLHTSLSTTVMLFAWRTREAYRTWVPIAWIIGIGVIIATMYLAIHWAIDVVAGFLLAGFAYWVGTRAIDDGWFEDVDVRGRLRSTLPGIE